MRKHHQKQILFVRSLLDKPRWYNETITHPAWKIIKRHINLNHPIPLIEMPPKLQEHYDELDQLKTWQQSYYAFALEPPKRVLVGATV